MCTNKNNFAARETQYYAGDALLGKTTADIVTVSAEKYKTVFPDAVSGWSYDLNKTTALRDGKTYRYGVIGGSAREITRMVLFAQTLNPTKCDARCRNARGPMCDCSCRGNNHGKGAGSFARAHNISLPSTKRKLNIDEATSALSSMGYRMGTVRHSLADKTSYWSVTTPTGSVVEVAANKLTDFVYGKIKNLNAQRYTETTYEVLFPDEDEDTQFIDSKEAAIKVARQYAAKGCTVELSQVTKTWRSKAEADAAQIPTNTKETPMRFFKDLNMKKSTYAVVHPSIAGVPLDPYTTKVPILLKDKTTVTAVRNDGRWSIEGRSEMPTARKFDQLIAELNAAGFTRTGAKAKFGSDTISVNMNAKRYLQILSRVKPDEGQEQFLARVKSRLHEVVNDTGEMIRNPNLESDYGGWKGSDLSEILSELAGSSGGLNRTLRLWLGNFSRVGTKAKFDRRVELDKWTSPKGTRYIAGFDTDSRGISFQPFVTATYSDGGDQLMSRSAPWFKSEKGARKWLANFMERMYSRTGTFSRVGAKSTHAVNPFNLPAKPEDWNGKIITLNGKQIKVERITGDDYILFDLSSGKRVKSVVKAQLDDAWRQGKIRDIFSRVGSKVKFCQPNTVSVRETSRGGYEIIYCDANGKLQSHSLQASKENAIARAKDFARMMGMQFVAGRTGSKVNMNKLTNHLHKISASLGFKPSSITMEDGVAKINFSQRDGSSGRLGVSLRKPLLDAGVTSDAITATADQVCVNFSQGANPARGTYPTSSGSSRLFSVQRFADGNYEMCLGQNSVRGGTVLRIGDRQSMLQELRELRSQKNDNFSRTGAKAEFGLVRVGRGSQNRAFLGKIDARTRSEILANIAAHYGISASEAMAEVTSDESEHLLEYVTGAMRPAVYVLAQKYGFSRTGAKAAFAQANQQIADGVSQLLSVLGFAAMAEEAKTTTDANTLKRYINVARRRVKGSDQSDRFNTLADKLERMLMSRTGGKAAFGAHPSWTDGPLGEETSPNLAAYSWLVRNNFGEGRKTMLLADLAVGMRQRSPSMSIAQATLAAAKDMVRKGVGSYEIDMWASNGGKFSRTGAKAAFAMIPKSELMTLHKERVAWLKQHAGQSNQLKLAEIYLEAGQGDLTQAVHQKAITKSEWTNLMHELETAFMRVEHGANAVTSINQHSRVGAKSAFAAEIIQKLSGGWVIEREGGILYLAKGNEAIPVPSVERALELHKSSVEGRLARRTGGFMSRTAVDKESFTTASFPRTGAKANNARPSLQEVMKSIDDYRASGASEEAVKQYSETVLRAWQAESGR